VAAGDLECVEGDVRELKEKIRDVCAKQE